MGIRTNFTSMGVTDLKPPSPSKKIVFTATYPFTDASYSSYLTTLIDTTNFKTDSTLKAIVNGSKSFNVNSGASYGYIKLDCIETQTLKIKCYTSSESNYDFGGIYIDTNVAKPTQTQIKNKTQITTTGTWLYTGSGNNTTVSEYTATLQAGKTYYINFAYAKDSSQNSNKDMFIITEISVS